MADPWLKCSACRNPISFNATHWVCSVSTCNRARTRLVFCTVSCWDSHVAMLRHRDAWAVEATAPTKDAWDKELASQPPEPVVAKPAAPPAPRRIVGEPASAAAGSAPVASVTRGTPVAAPAGTAALTFVAERDMLIVVSKLKKYIKDRSGMNCSDGVADVLSDHVRAICDESIRVAARDERKTVLDRDVPRARH